MKVRSWLSATCTTATTISADSTVPIPRNRHSNLSISDDSTDTSCSSSSSNSSSLQSNLSLQTLPSVPSLQHHHLLFPDNNLKLSDVVSHLCLSTFTPMQQQPITCLALHADLLFAASAHHVTVYDKTTHNLLDSFNAQNSSSGSVKSVAVCHGKVFTAHQDSKIRVWQTTSSSNKTHKLLTALPTVNDRLRRFVLPKNYVAVRRHKKLLWIEHADAVTGLAVNGEFIYSVSWDKSLKIWRASDLRCLESVKAHHDAVNAVVVSADGTVYTGSADRSIRVWAKPFGEKRHSLVATLEKHKSAVNALALNDDGSVLFSGACDRSILVWEREDSANYMVVAGALRGHGKAILSLTHVSGLLFSGSADRTVRMWRKGIDERYCCLAVLEGHERPVRSLVAVREGGESNDVVSVVSGSLDGEVKVWEVSLSNHNSPLSSSFLKLNS